VNRHSKASSVRSIPAVGGTRRLRVALTVLTLAMAALAITAGPALADTEYPAPPTVSDVSYTSAHVSVQIKPDGFASVQFQVSTDGGGTWTTKAEESASGSLQTVEADLTGLDDDTSYSVRAYSPPNPFFGKPEASSPAPDPSFTTLTADPPTIPGTVGTSNVFSTSATGTAKVERPLDSDDAKCHFEYVTEAEFGATGFTGATVRECVQNPIGAADAGIEKEVTAKLGCTNPVIEEPEGKCLAPQTTYHLRLVAETAGGAVTKDAAATFTTLAPVAAPTVLASCDATEIGKRTAKAAGEIERPAGTDPALDTSCRFEYVTDEQFTATGFEGAGRTPCAEAPAEAPLSATGPTPVSAEIGGLEPATTYHLRLTAQNGGGADSNEAAGTFETFAVVHPTFSLESVNEVGYTKAHLTGTLDPGNQGAFFTFEYALAGTEEWFELATLNGGGMVGSPGPGAPPKQLVWDLGPAGFAYHDPASGLPYEPQPGPGLQPGTTYKVRGAWRDTEEFNSYISPSAEFTTEGTSTPPTAALDPVTDFTGTTAHITGTVDPKTPAGPLSDEGKATYNTEWHLECTPECKDLNGNTIAGTVAAEGGAQPVSGEAKRLEPNKHYEVKLIIHNATGTVESSVQTFDTPLIKPTVKAAAGGTDGKGGFTLQGVVNPNNSPVSACEFKWGPNSASYAFSAPCSPAPGAAAGAVTVEAHLTGLTPGATYHYDLLATNGAGTEESGDQTFVATLSPAEGCENEQLRAENNSLALPECRAYEKVTPGGKEGFSAALQRFDGKDSAAYASIAGNLAKSGQAAVLTNYYVAVRSPAGWETIPDLNGSSGSLFDAPSYVNGASTTPRGYSQNLLTSLWKTSRIGDPPGKESLYLRNPDGTFTLIGPDAGQGAIGDFDTGEGSADLSHIVRWSNGDEPTMWGPGVYEYVGTGNVEPRRIDIDNSGAPITSCSTAFGVNAFGKSVSSDGRVIVFSVLGGCGGANPPAGEIWARVDGTTSFDVSASQCNRAAADPGGACNGPVEPTGCVEKYNSSAGDFEGLGCRIPKFVAATADGSRIFFTTTQQLVDGDIDQTRDIYACNIPPGAPAPVAGKSNPCAPLRQISATESGAAEVEEVLANSADGSTVLFTAKGVIASNVDALGEAAVAGDHNLYVWRQDSVHPEGQTFFVGRLDSNDVRGAEATPDGQYLVFDTGSQLVDTDTDQARDVYRYDTETGDLNRVSTNVLGVGGNGPFDAELPPAASSDGRARGAGITDDGKKIVFTTAEALSPADGNGEPDVYLWTPAGVSLISTGAVEGGVTPDVSLISIPFSIDGSGRDIFFQTAGALTPADGDDRGDVYDARVDGGFSFAQGALCSGEACQQPSSGPPVAPSPATAQAPADPGNLKPKACPKGKIAKGSKCVKKHTKKHTDKHHKKKSHKKHQAKKPGHKEGGGK
jgi:hypothetical protein